MERLDNRTVIQIGIIVRDAQAAARAYAEVFGIPQPEVVPIAADGFANTLHRGKPSDAKGKAAFFDLGSIQMELIEPVGSPSTWQEFLDRNGPGIHHLAFKTADMAESLAFLDGNGMPLIQSGGWDGGQYAYVDSTEKLGAILELLQFDR
jgi:catechol 2,3-dioxygenase-like lactoylglutathione lyase family enzyme